jgi:hypothetical protein
LLVTLHTLSDLRAGRLTGLNRLNLSEGLTELPREVLALADTLEVLNLSGNALHSLPDWLPELPHLKVLFCSDNQFKRVPEVVGACPQLSMVGFKSNQITEVPASSLPPALRWLILTGNRIEVLPETLGERPALEKLALAGNRLRDLPDTLAGAPHLALMRLSANAFDRFPDWLFELPALCWLALAGNPATQSLEQSRRADAARGGEWLRVPFDRLQWGAMLGEGASGHIHHVSLPLSEQHPQGQALALKVFKGELTSDGWPDSELAACLSVSPHPNLIGVTGLLQGHPQGRDGLFMPLVPGDHQALAGPPSLESCSRDVYPAGRTWPLHEAWQMAHDTASALAHLHAQGWMHGDFYAHNLMWRAGAPLRLGDFGAATPFEPGDATQARRMAALEVRAWGHFLQELLSHLAPAPDAQTLSGWWTLHSACVGPVAQRPDWAEVQQRLQALRP